MDELVSTCKPENLNLFVESFLKTVQRLLECQEPQMQALATQSVGGENGGERNWAQICHS